MRECAYQKRVHPTYFFEDLSTRIPEHRSDEEDVATGSGRHFNVNSDPYCGWPDLGPNYAAAPTSVSCAGDSYADGTADYPCAYTPYAYFRIENSAGGAGWACSIYDLSLFMRDLFVGPSVVLEPGTVSDMLTDWVPRGVTTTTTGTATRWQCFGWQEWLLNQGDLYKSGHFEGTHALAFNYAASVTGSRAGASVVYVFNRSATDEATFQVDINTALRGMTDWGSVTDDLFGGGV